MSRIVSLVQDCLSATARRLPWKEALVTEGCRYTYRELETSSNALAHSLAEHGVRHGDRVVILCENGHEAVIAFWGALKANAVAVPIDPATKSDELAYVLEDARPTAVITQARLAPGFDWTGRTSRHLKTIILAGEADVAIDDRTVLRWRDAIAEDASSTQPPRRTAIDIDLAVLLYTPTGMGEVAAVMLTHRNVVSAAAALSSQLECVQDDVVLEALPLSLGPGFYPMLVAFAAGASLLLEKDFDGRTTLDRIASERVSGIADVPAIFSGLVDAAATDVPDLSTVRWLTSTWGLLPKDELERLRVVVPKARLHLLYGLPECNLCIGLDANDLDRRPAVVGRPLSNADAWIADDAGAEVSPGTIGRLMLRGAAVMSGYWGRPGLTNARLRPGKLAAERALDTGDMASMDGEGNIYLAGSTSRQGATTGEAPRSALA